MRLKQISLFLREIICTVEATIFIFASTFQRIYFSAFVFAYFPIRCVEIRLIESIQMPIESI